jgi:hypothetical protein
MCLPVLVAAWGGIASASNAPIKALIGHRVAGVPVSWGPIVKFKYFRGRFSGQSAPPVLTGAAGSDGSLDAISFYEFASSSAATAFYLHPPSNLISILGGSPQPLSGRAPARSPSKWLDLELCIYEGNGPNPNHAPTGAPAGVVGTNGTCSVGVPTSGGIASITRQGKVVITVSPDGVRQSGKTVPTSVNAALTKKEIDYNISLTHNTLTLLDQVGIT